MPNVQAHMIGKNNYDLGIDCNYVVNEKKQNKWDKCMVKELCAKVKSLNDVRKKLKKSKGLSPSDPDSPKHRAYKSGLDKFSKLKPKESQFTASCRYKEWKKGNGGNLDRDHVHDAALGGSLSDMNNIKWLNYRVNRTMGARMKKYKPPAKIILPKCNCPKN